MPVDEDDLVGDGGGDPSLLPVVVPSAGWMVDPDDPDRFINRGCATQDELDELTSPEFRVASADEDDDLDGDLADGEE